MNTKDHNEVVAARAELVLITQSAVLRGGGPNRLKDPEFSGPANEALQDLDDLGISISPADLSSAAMGPLQEIKAIFAGEDSTGG